MDVDNVLGEMAVDVLVAFVQNNEKEVEAGHDWRAHVDVGAEGGFPVVAPSDWIGSGEDAGSCVQRGLDSGFGDGNGLLFHCFVDGYLVANVHFIKFINGANTIVCEHERTGFNRELSSFLIFDYRSGKACCRRGFPRGVDCAWKKGTYVSEKLLFS